MTLLKWISTICFIVIFYGYSSAQTIVTDRPDQTESSSTVPKSSLQIESGVLLSFSGERTNEVKQWLAPTTLFRVGVTKGFELRFLSQYEILNNYSSANSSNGISDIEIGTKIQLFKKEHSTTEVAFLSHLIIPTGSVNLSGNQYGTINKLSISHSFLENIGIGYNLGYNNFDGGSGDLTYSLALGFSINDKTGVYIEPYGELTEFEDFVANFDAGFTHLVEDNLQLDLSFGTGLNNTMNYISLGFSWLLR